MPLEVECQTVPHLKALTCGIEDKSRFHLTVFVLLSLFSTFELQDEYTLTLLTTGPQFFSN